jgi:hypothetical protein
MHKEGWRSGRYQPDRLTHDALIPFDELSRADRLALDLNVTANELAERLIATVDYPRGPDRPFTIDDIKQGVRVALSCGLRLTRAELGHDQGEIVSWEVSNGDLALITVRWDDGEMASYNPWERALVRISELE